MPIEFKIFDELVTDQIKAIQSSATEDVDFTIGSVNLALVEATAEMGVFIEYLANAILARARASTSTGNNLDSWMAQFRFIRIGAVASSGNVTYSRFNTSGSASISVGSVVKTADFEIEFKVVPDTNNPNYNPASQTYTMNGGDASVLVKVECTTAGEIGNVGENEITFISSPIPGVDTVTNTVAFTNGKNQESDAEFRARFILYINSLSRAVLPAYESVLANIPEITRYNVVENKSYTTGEAQPGYVYTVIDDGTGSPDPSLIDKALAAIETVRGLAIQNDVFAPVVTNISISVELKINTVQSESTILSLVEKAISEYIASISFDEILPYTKLYEIIYDVSPNILNVENLQVNNGTNDIAGGDNIVFIIQTINIVFLS